MTVHLDTHNMMGVSVSEQCTAVLHGVVHMVGAVLPSSGIVRCWHATWCLVAILHGGVVSDACKYFDVVSPMEIHLY